MSDQLNGELMGRAEVIVDGITRSSGMEDMKKRCWGARCHPHRRKHCIAPILQIAVLPNHQSRVLHEKGDTGHTVNVHTAEVGGIASYSTGHVGRERHYGRRKDKDKSEKDDVS